MAHGTPDWGVTAGGVTTYQLTDLAELAARLGSPITHDRRGDVMWWDDFEWSLNKWETSAGGTGAAVALSTARARNGQTSCLLTAGSDAGRSATIEHAQAPASVARFGAEISFSRGSVIDNFALQMSVRRAGVETFYLVTWDDVSDELQYTDSAGVQQTIASGVSLLVGASTFHTLKVVGDADAREFVRVILNETEHSLAGVAARETASALDDYVSMVVELTGRSGNNDTVYVDDAIITANEPA